MSAIAASEITVAASAATEPKIVPFPVISEAISAIHQVALLHKQQLFDLYKKYPFLVTGDYKKGEIQVVIACELVAKIEETVRKKLLDKGKSEIEAFEWSRAGIVSQDAYHINVRDAVYFPNGTTGLYNRLLERSALEGAGHGAIALPLQQDGKILFNYTYRHATGSWGFELARGLSDERDNQSLSATCRRELEEETGMKSKDPISTGIACANTGVSGVMPSFFVCPLTEEGIAKPEKEAIKKCVPFSPQEVANALVNGFFVHEGSKVPFVDGFSMIALQKAVAAGHIHLPIGQVSV